MSEEAPRGVCLLRACGCRPLPNVQKVINADLKSGKISGCDYLRNSDPRYRELLEEAAEELEPLHLAAYFDGEEWHC